ncbi:cytochrome P450, partial [Candidatus Gracilibacteria bacterium]|nr:cytochrome P450 [Candidatus Gracilibacteria bacterium]
MSPLAPGPRSRSLLGMLPTIRRDVLGFVRDTQRSYGDVARYRLGPLMSHLVSHPDSLKYVLQDNVKNYSKNHISYAMVRWTVGNGILTSQGDFWLRQRRLAQPAFHRQRLALLADGMVRATQELIDSWQPHIARGQYLEIGEEMMRLTLRIVADALFGTDLSAQTQQISRSFNELSAQTIDRFRTFRILPPVLPTADDRAFRQAQHTLTTVVRSIIAERRRNPVDRGDLLSMLMLAVDEETGAQMSDDQLRDEVITMLLAGHETTATVLGWVWAMLDRHPAVADRLHE